MKELESIFLEKQKNIVLLINVFLIIISIIYGNIYFGLFLTLVFFYLLFYKIRDIIIIKNICEQINLETLKQEIQNPVLMFNDYIFTDNYIIKYLFNIYIIKYSDIKIVHNKIKLMSKGFGNILLITTKQKKKYKILLNFFPLPFKNKNSDVEKLLRYKNQNILFK